MPTIASSPLTLGKQRRSQVRQSSSPPIRPPPRRWPPSQTIATTSWPSSRPLLSNIHESSRPKSPFAWTSARVWFQRWTNVNLPKPPKPAPQYHLGLTGVLTDVVTRLHTTEVLHPVVATQREAEKETKGLDRLPPKSHRVILAASATTRTSTPTSPPPTIHCFLNARNARDLQADFSLTYAGNNIYLPTYFCQAFLQGHILAIPDPEAPT